MTEGGIVGVGMRSMRGILERVLRRWVGFVSFVRARYEVRAVFFYCDMNYEGGEVRAIDS